MANSEETTRSVLDRCKALGFALAGIARPAPSQHERELRDWLAAGKHGEMGYLAEHTTERLDPREMVPGVRSIICVADRYHDGADAAETPAAGAGPRGRIARYARGDDYHLVMKKRLHMLADELAARFPAEYYRRMSLERYVPVTLQNGPVRPSLVALAIISGSHFVQCSRQSGSRRLWNSGVVTSPSAVFSGIVPSLLAGSYRGTSRRVLPTGRG